MSNTKNLTETDIQHVDHLIDSVLGEKAAEQMKAAAAKPTFKEIWPAMKAILLIVKSTFGLFKPSWKVAIDVFISGMDTYVAGGTVEPA